MVVVLVDLDFKDVVFVVGYGYVVFSFVIEDLLCI